MLCVVPTCVDEVNRCDKAMCAAWLRELGVRRNDAHAGTDFIGPECKKILDGVDKLAEKTSDEARAKFKRSREEYTPEERLKRAVAPPDPHDPK